MSKDYNDNSKILDDISSIKKQINDINTKVDLILDILNNFTFLIDEDEEVHDDNYDDDESWVPMDQDEEWNSYDDDDEEM